LPAHHTAPGANTKSSVNKNRKSKQPAFYFLLSNKATSKIPLSHKTSPNMRQAASQRSDTVQKDKNCWQSNSRFLLFIPYPPSHCCQICEQPFPHL